MVRDINQELNLKYNQTIDPQSEIGRSMRKRGFARLATARALGQSLWGALPLYGAAPKPAGGKWKAIIGATLPAEAKLTDD